MRKQSSKPSQKKFPMNFLIPNALKVAVPVKLEAKFTKTVGDRIGLLSVTESHEIAIFVTNDSPQLQRFGNFEKDGTKQIPKELITLVRDCANYDIGLLIRLVNIKKGFYALMPSIVTYPRNHQPLTLWNLITQTQAASTESETGKARIQNFLTKCFPDIDATEARASFHVDSFGNKEVYLATEAARSAAEIWDTVFDDAVNSGRRGAAVPVVTERYGDEGHEMVRWTES